MPPALRVESLWKCYAAGVRGCSARAWVLRGLSLTVQAGERVAIVGAAASGKTTLAECILGLRPPSAGIVEIAATVDIIDLQNVGGSACRTVRRPKGQEPVVRPSDSPTSVLVLARRPDSLETWADRVLLLCDGRLREMSSRPALRVAERTMTTTSGAISLR